MDAANNRGGAIKKRESVIKWRRRTKLLPITGFSLSVTGWVVWASWEASEGHFHLDKKVIEQRAKKDIDNNWTIQSLRR